MLVECSNCLEVLNPGDDLTSTPCGHVFHMACVVQWFTIKKNCPLCRQSANERNLRKIYLVESNRKPEVINAENLQNQLDIAKFQLRCKEGQIKDQTDALRTQARALREESFKFERCKKRVVMMETFMKNERCIADIRQKKVSIKQEIDKRKMREMEVQVRKMKAINRSLEGEVWKCKEQMKANKDKEECLGRGEASHLSPDVSPPPYQHSAPSHPRVSTTQPSYKLACSVKRPLSPDSDRSPLLPLLNHSRKRLAVAGGGQAVVPSCQPHTSLRPDNSDCMEGTQAGAVDRSMGSSRSMSVISSSCSVVTRSMTNKVGRDREKGLNQSVMLKKH
eukprot:GFUD01029146.1.p1 GENE.GFUD01029146.1~~GFUD01029146.1.p1  ORF type:complete len:335 (+),score=108.53 GFUD01029146.1:75-1079(+)